MIDSTYIHSIRRHDGVLCVSADVVAHLQANSLLAYLHQRGFKKIWDNDVALYESKSHRAKIVCNEAGAFIEMRPL